MHAAAVLPANRGIGSGLGQQRPNGGRLSMTSTKARRRSSNSIHLMAASVATLLLLLTSIMYSYIKLPLQSHQDAHFSFGQNGLNNIPPSDNNNKRRSRPLILPGWKALPYGWGVKPQTILQSWNISLSDEKERNNNINNTPARKLDPKQMLKAYLEPIDYTTWWHNKPLPVRATATAQQLTEISYPSVNSCRRLPEQWPTDEFPDADPFLPWIHDVFPTHDGKYIQFVAQNKRRCRTGTTEDDITTLQHMAPQVALFQHVPVKRITSSSSSSSTRRRHNNETRYRLAAHEEADPDGMATRFICRFKPLMKETLSVFNVDYDYAAYRKEYRKTFSEEGRDNKSVHTSQLIFQCPVPNELVEKIRTGSSVQDDWATIFVDVIPIRTPPRYGIPDQFFPPWYKSFETLKPEWKFDPRKEWGDDHILPAIEDSGRWENIPICKPSLLTYEPPPQQQRVIEEVADENVQKKHHLVACVWASAGYTTRGHRFAINDGQRRLLEWIQFHQLVGFDHFYVYDNSGAFSKDVSLQPITDLFPNLVTRISWPAKVCNNNPNNVDSPGERSSQYAAESSCRLRFGANVNWIGSFDLDEYIVPVGKYNSLLPLLEKLDKQHKKIVSFGSWRSWPRREYIQDPIPIKDPDECWSTHSCFDLNVREDRTVLQAYNCNRQKGRKTQTVPAEKQIYRPDYVKQHFIHYSCITELTLWNRTEWRNHLPHQPWIVHLAADPLSRFADELTEATMLHTKAIARQDTSGWLHLCKDPDKGKGFCRIGNPWPPGAEEAGVLADSNGWIYNCYIDEKIEHYWVPHLESALRDVINPKKSHAAANRV